MKRIFISHSIQDKETAKMLSDFLMQMGIDGEKIMCSSLPFSQIPINQNIYDYLKKILQDDNIVVLLLSENYYKSATCLNEMGAAWIRELPMIPILLSGFKVEKVEGVIDNSKIVIRLDDEEGVLKDRLREMQKSIAEYLNIQLNSRIGEYALESFIKNTRNVENQVAYIDMLKVETYCIGEYHHDGCRVIHRESDNKRTVAQIEFGKTKAYLCSIVYKIKRNDWTRLWKENRNLHFWLECSKAALCNIEVHFENECSKFLLHVPEDKTQLYIPLKQFEDDENCWKSVKEICFVFDRDSIKRDIKVKIENLEVV